MPKPKRLCKTCSREVEPCQIEPDRCLTCWIRQSTRLPRQMWNACWTPLDNSVRPKSRKRPRRKGQVKMLYSSRGAEFATFEDDPVEDDDI
jgi:hypothetical protein